MFYVFVIYAMPSRKQGAMHTNSEDQWHLHSVTRTLPGPSCSKLTLLKL